MMRGEVEGRENMNASGPKGCRVVEINISCIHVDLAGYKRAPIYPSSCPLAHPRATTGTCNHSSNLIPITARKTLPRYASHA